MYREVDWTDQALKQEQPLCAFDDMYFKAQKDAHIEYSNTSTLDLITHLYSSYENITQIELSKNDNRMKAPYNVTMPIENLFAQIDEAVEFTDAGNAPFTAIQIVTTAYLPIFRTGKLKKACDDWDKKAEGAQT